MDFTVIQNFKFAECKIIIKHWLEEQIMNYIRKIEL